jgi:ribosomal protein S18 acetylase RimI-like enzyme
MKLQPLRAGDLDRNPSLLGEIDGVLMRAYLGTSKADRVLRWLAVQPDGWVIARASEGEDAAVIGCGGFIAYTDGGFGWIGLIATDPTAERRGVGRALTQWCVDELTARGCASVLDGSGKGSPLYESMGFADLGWSAVYSYVDAAGAAGDGERPDTLDVATDTVRPVTPSDSAAIVALDQRVFGADRTRLLTYVIERYANRGFLAERQGELVGYVCAQDDAIGPLVAIDDQSARSLIRRAVSLEWAAPPTIRVGPPRQVSPDAPDEFFRRNGFVLQRKLRRQHLGIGELPGERMHLYGMASFGEG